MTFLQPFIFYGLPLIGLPLLIHLINRQRHRTIPWAAMLFLLDANRLQKNMAKLRYWLIMAMRMLAIAGLLFAASRPFASGWLGTTIGSRADTTIILLDRSPSMQQREETSRGTKRETAVGKLADFLEQRGKNRTILIENTTYTAAEVPLDQLTQLSEVGPADTTADLPRMFQAALDYLVDNEVGQTDVWVISDLRRSDWQADDGRWAGLRQAFAEREGVRIHLLTYPRVAADNLAVTVTSARKRSLPDAQELVLDVQITRSPGTTTERTVPLEFVVNGARSVTEVLLDKDSFLLQGHTIPLDASLTAGWGRVEIPGDANDADNAHYFVFADEPQRLTTIVSADDASTAPWRIATTRGADPAIEFSAVVLAPAQVNELDWTESTLILWHAPLPEGLLAKQLQSFLDSGRPVIFFPPDSPTPTALWGIQWGDWQEASSQDPIGIASMQSDSDLLARTQSGLALPLNKQQTLRYCQLRGSGKALARLSTGDPLLLRAPGDIPAYFCATLPRSDYSSLARDGVVLYVMLQRALQIGAGQQGDARNIPAGDAQLESASQWSLLSELPANVVSSDRAFHAGAYQHEDAFVSINRPPREDNRQTISDADLESMLSGLDYHQIRDDVGADSPLASEVWRLFLALMAVALIVEAGLCLT